MRTLIAGTSRFYDDGIHNISLDQVRAFNISCILKSIQDNTRSFVRLDSQSYGINTTEWLCYNPRTGSLFVHTSTHVLYTDYNCDNQSYTVESQHDSIASITLEEAQEYFEVSLRLI